MGLLMWTFGSAKPSPPQELINFLKTVKYFQALPKKCIYELACEFQATYIQSGEIVMREGEPGDGLFVLQTGRLLIVKNNNTINEQIIGEVERGELVGEFALFTEGARSATVVAIRDSVLWKLSKKHFDLFIQKNSTHIMPMVRAAILKLLGPKTEKKRLLRVLALAPAGRYSIDPDFVYRLVEELSLFAPTLLINDTLIKRQFEKKLDVRAELSDPIVSGWLHDLEQKYTYVLYETDATNTEWTRLCLRQADKILLIGEAKDNPKLGDIEHYLFNSLDKVHRSPIELVLLHQMKIILPNNTLSWLKERSITRVHHLKEQQDCDIQRLVRMLTGRAIALVLGGGGAKSLAQIGVYKALCELNIPVDCVGGTSMGSAVAGGISMDLSASSIIDLVDRFVIKNKKFNDYTVPLVSLLGGEGWLNSLKKIFGEDIYIEDLWKPFFCVASNFTLRRVEILDKGSLYKSVRASASLPGVVPPISNEFNELLIDGGIFNNLPVDIMRSIVSPCVVIAVRVAPFSNVHAEIPDGVVSGLKRYMSRFGNDSLKKFADVPSLSEIVAGAITLCNDHRELAQFANADHSLDIDLSKFGILDFPKFPQLVEAGYKAAMDKFQNWPSDTL